MSDSGFPYAFGQSKGETINIPQFALPDYDDIPSFTTQAVLVGFVAFDGSLKLWEPIFPASGWSGGARAVCMSVPETAVNEYCGFVLRKNDIGLSGKIFAMKAKPESKSMQKRPDG